MVITVEEILEVYRQKGLMRTPEATRLAEAWAKLNHARAIAIERIRQSSIPCPRCEGAFIITICPICAFDLSKLPSKPQRDKRLSRS